MDEPFYGAYLSTTGLGHPMAAEIIAAHDTDWDRIAETCATVATSPLIYQKHMSQHMVEVAPLDWMTGVRHAFLIRPPAEVAASFKVKWQDMTADDLGFERQAELFDQVANRLGCAPPVIEARDVLTNPKGMLQALCAALGVPFDPAMLHWQPGLHDSDGVWARHWYGAVEASTGFAPPTLPKQPPDDVMPICLLYTSPSPRDRQKSRMPSSA